MLSLAVSQSEDRKTGRGQNSDACVSACRKSERESVRERRGEYVCTTLYVVPVGEGCYLDRRREQDPSRAKCGEENAIATAENARWWVDVVQQHAIVAGAPLI